MNEKIMTDRSLIVLALDALDELNYSNSTESAEYQYYEATKLLRAALEQPQAKHETVGKAGPMPGADGFTMACFRASDVSVGTELYTHPQPKPLTDEAVLGVAKSIEIQFDSERLNEQIDDILAFARAIEAAHGIKEQK